ncbi:MAG: hypothetical protein V3T70_11255 [Phycisphaerae bacterium]
MSAKERPRGAGDANTALHLGTGPHYTVTTPDRQPFCELHRVPIVHQFPPRCPMATPRPLVSLWRLKDAAWTELGRLPASDADLTGALDLLDQVEIGECCYGRLSSDPVVLRLRAPVMEARR